MPGQVRVGAWPHYGEGRHEAQAGITTRLSAYPSKSTIRLTCSLPRLATNGFMASIASSGSEPPVGAGFGGGAR
jgi:hypothetical protein